MLVLDSLRLDQAAPDDLIELGRIGDPYGIKGWVNILSYSADSTALKSAKTWFLRWPPGQWQSPVSPDFPVRIAQSRLHSGRLVAQVQGVVDRNVAEQLKGATVWVSRSLFPPLKKGEFYWVDLIGLSVVNREGVDLGLVQDVIDHGAHPILCLPGEGDLPERMIPFVPAYIDAVDIDARRIVVDWQTDY